MPIQAKNIDGFMLGTYPKECSGEYFPDRYETGYNRAIQEQGQRSLTLNRERLAKNLFNHRFKNTKAVWESSQEFIKDYFYEQADFLISHDAELIEYEGEK